MTKSCPSRSPTKTNSGSADGSRSRSASTYPTQRPRALARAGLDCVALAEIPVVIQHLHARQFALEHAFRRSVHGAVGDDDDLERVVHSGCNTILDHTDVPGDRFGLVVHRNDHRERDPFAVHGSHFVAGLHDVHAATLAGRCVCAFRATTRRTPRRRPRRRRSSASRRHWLSGQGRSRSPACPRAEAGRSDR